MENLNFGLMNKGKRDRKKEEGCVSTLFPCGYSGDSVKPCTCPASTVTKYQKRISGPMLDRKAPWFVGCRHPHIVPIFWGIEAERVDYGKRSSDRMGEPSAVT